MLLKSDRTGFDRARKSSATTDTSQESEETQPGYRYRAGTGFVR